MKVYYKKILIILILINCSLLLVSCSKKFNPTPLSISVRQNLAYLQSDPQFVMYFNFKKMRDTGFWKKFISDSLFTSERNFGSFLNILKTSTGASITNGIDELYFSNSWIGDNALLIKGTFDRAKVNNYVNSDSLYTKLSYPNNVTVFNQTAMHFYFYFKDDFTVCASNYLPQIERTLSITDISKTGLLENEQAVNYIQRIKDKDQLWMMSSQKLFIRGIFENFSDMRKGKNKPREGIDTIQQADTSQAGGEMDAAGIYKNIEAVSFSVKMTEDLSLVMQNECTDEGSASELKNKLDAVIALSKLSAQFSKKSSGPMVKILDKIDTHVYDKTLLLETILDEKQITEIRKQKIF